MSEIHNLAMEAAAKRALPGADYYRQASKILAGASPLVVRDLAVRMLIELGQAEERTATLLAERHAREAARIAKRDAETPEERATRKAARKDIREQNAAERARERADYAAGITIGDRFRLDMLAAMEPLKMEWTRELLSSVFSLRDGSRITWGAATVAQHQERVDMFQVNAVANLEGAARHASAIEVLTNAGVRDLWTLTGSQMEATG